MTKNTNATLADDLREMMSAWDDIQAAARAKFPDASAAEIDEIVKSAMDHSLGIAAR